MKTYRLEVRAFYPRNAPLVDLDAQIVSTLRSGGVTDVEASTRRVGRTGDLVVSAVKFPAPGDDNARMLLGLLRSAMQYRMISAEVDSLRTGTGRHMRRIS